MGFWNTYTMIYIGVSTLTLLYNACDFAHVRYRYNLGLPQKSHRFSMVFTEGSIEEKDWEGAVTGMLMVVVLWPLIIICGIGYLGFCVVKPVSIWSFNTMMKWTLSKEDRATVALGVAKLRKSEVSNFGEDMS